MATDTATESSILQSIVEERYASENVLQTYDVYIPPRQTSNPEAPTDGYFLVFIHGGYFRDPTASNKAFHPTISLIESSPEYESIRPKITGYATIDYRLSPHPDHPQPSTTPPYTLNNAFWPSQTTDILSALRHLQSHHPQAARYILSGHSVGATLTFLSTLLTHDANVIAPAHIIGFNGIYDFPHIHETNPGYEALTSNAMDPSSFIVASPALYPLTEYIERWKAGSGRPIVMIAHSRSDELVAFDQAERIERVFGGRSDVYRVETVEIVGRHYEAMDNGEVARCFRLVLEGAGRE